MTFTINLSRFTMYLLALVTRYIKHNMSCRRNPDERIINYSACIQRCQNKARKRVYWFVNINISQTHRQRTERIKHFKALDQPVGNETIWLMYITAWPSVKCTHLVIDFFPHRQKLKNVLRCACCIITTEWVPHK